ncbi:MAG: hypothetical protein HRT72_09720 [Flavobacteriales bacterium]|nr:hypothetical protein [Flavobacteriales bacterium]
MSNIFRGKKINSRIWTFMLCLGISSFFWYLMALSETYTASVSFPVEYQNEEKGLVLMNDLPDELVLHVRSRGFNLMSYKYFSDHEPIVVKIEDLKERRISQYSHRFLLTDDIRSDLEEQIKGKVEVIDINPDTLHFDFDRKRKKMVKVKLMKDFNFLTQYQVYGDIALEPSMVEITGAKSMLDTITEVQTELLSKIDLKEGFSQKALLSMDSYKGRVITNTESIKVDVQIEKYTEGIVEAEIKIANLPSEYSINTFPSKVNIRYLVALRDYEAVQNDYYSVKADFAKERVNPNKLNLEVNEISRNVDVISIEPNKVEFIINK